VVGSCEHGNEPSGSIKWKILGLLRNWPLLKKASALWSWLMAEMNVSVHSNGTRVSYVECTSVCLKLSTRFGCFILQKIFSVVNVVTNIHFKFMLPVLLKCLALLQLNLSNPQNGHQILQIHIRQVTISGTNIRC
jgi:hypothetical protein